MEQKIFFFFLNDISIISCDIDKIETMIKVLQKTLVEDCDFELKDSQNLCSLLNDEVCILKQKVSKLENSIASNKKPCR